MSLPDKTKTSKQPIDPVEDGRACLKAARRYLKMGLSVLPLCWPGHPDLSKKHLDTCPSAGKVPWLRWDEYQTRLPTEAEVLRWWEQRPLSNVGVALGPVSNLIRVNIEGAAGEAEFQRRSGGKATDTLEFTSGKGRGLLYAIPEGVDLRTTVHPIEVGAELRIQGKGAQSALPPSRHKNGKRYKYVPGHGPGEIEIAPAMPWMIREMSKPAARAKPAAKSSANGQALHEGKRNDSLFKLACSMRAKGFGTDAIVAALMEHNHEKCVPPLDDNEVRGVAESAGKYEPGSAADDKKPTQSALLVEVALAEPIKLWHGQDGEGYASITIGGHVENFRIRSKGFRRWLARLFHEKYGKPPSEQAKQDTIAVLESRAIFDGPQETVAVRLAGRKSAIYLDLGDPDWQAVRITRKGWEIVATPRVKFIRPRGLLALPEPIREGSIDTLRRFINVGSDDDFKLLVAWLLAALRPTGPYPVLVLHGEQGAAKSTAARILRALFDPNTAPLRSEPREVRDLMIAAKNAWGVVFDNLGHLRPGMSDSLCRLATGGGFSTRELFTDEEEIIFDAQRPVILTAIEMVASRGDLADRGVIINLPAIRDGSHKPEAELWVDFNAAAPGILGALLAVVATGLKRLPTVKAKHLPRMADFAKWIIACEPALGWEPGSFLEAYTANRRTANAVALDDSLIVPVLIDLLGVSGRCKGTVNELLVKLTANAGEKLAEHDAWPRTPHKLSGMLRRLAPNLRRTGVEIVFLGHGERGSRLRIERVGKLTSGTSGSSKPSKNQGEPPDDAPGDQQAKVRPSSARPKIVRQSSGKDQPENCNKPWENRRTDDPDLPDDEIPFCSNGHVKPKCEGVRP